MQIIDTPAHYDTGTDYTLLVEIMQSCGIQPLSSAQINVLIPPPPSPPHPYPSPPQARLDGHSFPPDPLPFPFNRSILEMGHQNKFLCLKKTL